LEPTAEVGDPPGDLSLLVLAAGQGHDQVIVVLGQCVAVAPAALATEPIGLDDSPVHFGGLDGDPLQERRAEIEADPGVVVQEVADPTRAVEQPRAGIRRVTFARDPLVPVVERGRGVLDLDDVEPGVLAGRLVEVAVDAKISGIAHAWNGPRGTRCRAARSPRRSGSAGGSRDQASCGNGSSLTVATVGSDPSSAP